MGIKTSEQPYERSESHLTSESFQPSARRDFFKTRDLGLQAATNGDFRMVVHKMITEPTPTGWHYHECDLQVIYVLNGFVILGFEDGRVVRLEPGSSMNIPSGMIHNELTSSEDLEIMELTSPPEITTVLVDDPALELIGADA